MNQTTQPKLLNQDLVNSSIATNSEAEFIRTENMVQKIRNVNEDYN